MAGEWTPIGPDELAASLKITASGDTEQPPSLDVYAVFFGSESTATELLDDLAVRAGTDPASAFVASLSFPDTRRFWAHPGAAEEGTTIGSARHDVAPPDHLVARSEFPPAATQERNRGADADLHPGPAIGRVAQPASLLGGDVSVAWQRDGHAGTSAPAGLSESELIRWLDDVQVEWVHAARRLSPRLVVDLLVWTSGQVVDLVSSQDPSAVTANVSWASSEPVPVWLDQARELSERWIHRQQILQAVDRPSDLRRDLAEPVLDGLRWANPFRLNHHRRPQGSTVAITVTAPLVRTRWNLVSDGASWQFSPDAGGLSRNNHLHSGGVTS